MDWAGPPRVMSRTWVVKPAKARSVVHQASTVESDASGAELIVPGRRRP
jgi:hypothetical protein